MTPTDPAALRVRARQVAAEAPPLSTDQVRALRRIFLAHPNPEQVSGARSRATHEDGGGERAA